MVPIKSHQHISIRGDKQTITEDFKPVHKWTRAGNNGKTLAFQARFSGSSPLTRSWLWPDTSDTLSRLDGGKDHNG